MGILNYIRKEKSNSIRNRVKYYIISGILDVLVMIKHLDGGKDSPTFGEVMSRFYDLYTNFDIDNRVTVAQIEVEVLLEMEWMNLVSIDKKESNSNQWKVSITKNGLKAYQDQKFHIISADMYASKSASDLSITAILIAIASIIISLIFGILNQCSTQNVDIVGN